jgi:hypothetical protein
MMAGTLAEFSLFSLRYLRNAIIDGQAFQNTIAIGLFLAILTINHKVTAVFAMFQFG